MIRPFLASLLLAGCNFSFGEGRVLSLHEEHGDRGAAVGVSWNVGKEGERSIVAYYTRDFGSGINHQLTLHPNWKSYQETYDR